MNVTDEIIKNLRLQMEILHIMHDSGEDMEDGLMYNEVLLALLEAEDRIKKAVEDSKIRNNRYAPRSSLDDLI